MFTQPLLALDTSAGTSVCLYMPDGASFSDSMTTPRAHSKELLPLLHGLLLQHGVTWQDIGAFAVGVGPGSFTGLRVACATIAGINASLQRPVYPLCSLSIAAKQADVTHAVWSIEDARSGLVYAALYQNGQVLKPATCMTWDMFSSLTPAPYITTSSIPVTLDDGWQVMLPKLSREQALIAVVKAIEPAQPSATWVEPTYLQPSQAERNML